MLPFYVVVWSYLDRTVSIRLFPVRSEADGYADEMVAPSAGHVVTKVGMVAPPRSSSLAVALWLRGHGMTLAEACEFVNFHWGMNIERQTLRHEELKALAKKW